MVGNLVEASDHKACGGAASEAVRSHISDFLACTGLKTLKNDNRYIFATSAASKVHRYLMDKL